MSKADYPRCSTCRHWRKAPEDLRGDCRKMESHSEWAEFRKGGTLAMAATSDDDRPADVLTQPDFGCIMHEARDAAG